MRSVISVENLSKRYIIGHQRDGKDGLRHAIEDAVRNPFKWLFNRKKSLQADREEFWALKDISFQINQGDVVGIVGRNGAGKSTLLKILSRITEPTAGRIKINGRVASLLEVGTGFHPELTGRENIFLNGAILGMSRVEIKRKFDEIVAFSEIEKFLDTPVKRYSSGMYVRLAFAVAAHLEPEILIIDEVLAVGDSQFQKKCLGKMDEVSRAGRTVLFVSHNMTAVSTLCSRALLLESGQKRMEGETEKVISTYINFGASSASEINWDATSRGADNGRLRLAKARILCDGKVSADVEIDKPVIVQYDFDVLKDGLNVSSSIHLLEKHGSCVLATGTSSNVLNRGRYQHSCVFPANFLNDGRYSISIFLITDVTRLDVALPEAISFFVHETKGRGEYLGVVAGCVRPHLEWMEKSLNGTHS